MVSIIHSFLKGWYFYIKISETKSSLRNIRDGITQGFCLSPYLFSVYVDDMPSVPEAKIALFSNDTICYATIDNNCSKI